MRLAREDANPSNPNHDQKFYPYLQNIKLRNVLQYELQIKLLTDLKPRRGSKDYRTPLRRLQTGGKAPHRHKQSHRKAIVASKVINPNHG